MAAGVITRHPDYAYVGCFTTAARKARGRGISVYRIERATGAWTLVEISDALPNPGFLALDRTEQYLYVAHGSGTEISAYALDRQSGRLQLLNTQPTHGDNSNHLAVDPRNRYVVLANGPGVAVFPINGDGTLAPASDVIVTPGERGPYRREQHGPHPHQILFDHTGRFIIVPDKGLDRLHVYTLDGTRGRLVANDPPGVKTRYGAVPRHMTIHPQRPYAYVVNEMESTVTAYHWDAQRGELKPFQVLPTTPATWTGNNTGGEIAIAPSGNYVYASNRGHDSIVIYAVDAASGRLTVAGWEPTRGRKPRFFALHPDGGVLYAANADSDTIVTFNVDHAGGGLTPTGQVVATESPTCIVFTYSSH